MKLIDFFKLQSKQLKRDFDTKKKVYDETIDGFLFEFSPKHFDVEYIEVTYDLSKEEIENFTLMKAQHFIAQLVGFRKWNELIKATEEELELAKLLFENQHKLSIEDWTEYVAEAEVSNNISLSSKDRLEVFKMVFMKEGDFATMPNDFRLR